MGSPGQRPLNGCVCVYPAFDIIAIVYDTLQHELLLQIYVILTE